MPGLLGRLLCGCVAPQSKSDAKDSPVENAPPLGSVFKKAPDQPDSPPVKPRAPPGGHHVAAVVTLKAAARAWGLPLEHTASLRTSAIQVLQEQERGVQEQVQGQQEPGQERQEQGQEQQEQQQEMRLLPPQKLHWRGKKEEPPVQAAEPPEQGAQAAQTEQRDRQDEQPGQGAQQAEQEGAQGAAEPQGALQGQPSSQRVLQGQPSSSQHEPSDLFGEEGSLDVLRTLPSGQPPQAPVVRSAGPRGEDSNSSSSSGAASHHLEHALSAGTHHLQQAAPAPAASSAGNTSEGADASSPTHEASSSASHKGSHEASCSAPNCEASAASVSTSGTEQQRREMEEETDVVGALRKSRLLARKPPAAGKALAATARMSASASPKHQPPLNISSLCPPLPTDLAAALANLGTPHPMDPIADLNVVRAAAVHSRAVLEPQLDTLVPLLLRTMRAPRLATARAAILTFQDLFAAEGLGDAMCTSGAIADDSGPTSSAILALMQRATGADLNSKRIAGDANACLCTMVECVPPLSCIEILQNYATSPKVHTRVRAKAGALLVAAAYRLAVTDVQAFDKVVMSTLLKICEPLLGSGTSCRQTAKKLAVVIYSAFSNQPHMHVLPPGSPLKGGRTASSLNSSLSLSYTSLNASLPRSESVDVKEAAWADFVRLQVEPEAAAAIGEAVSLYGTAGQELVAAADLDGFALGHPVKEIVSRLVLAAE